MDAFDEEAVFERLSDYHAAFAEAFRAAWKRWLKIAPAFSGPYRRTRRTVMYQFISEEVRSRLADREPDVLLRDTSHERVLLTFPAKDGIARFTLRFKHVDEKLLSRTYPTKTAIAFDNGGALPGLAQARVTAGYRLDDLEEKLIGMFVIHANRTKVWWSYEIGTGESGTLAKLPPQLPLAGLGGRKAAALVKIKPAVLANRKKKHDSNK